MNENETTVPPMPMVVWLRGDEEYFGDFSLEADEVMGLLGIKRSRLTQISGKELRVGRKRVDRYIRPIYRRVDVEEYLAWSRPTASHQKSSQVLNEAATELSQLGDELRTNLESANRQFEEALQRQEASASNFLLDLTSEILGRFQRSSLQAIDQLLTLDERLQQKQQSLHETLHESMTQLAQNHLALRETFSQILNQQSYQNQLCLGLQERQEKLSEALQSISEQITSLQKQEEVTFLAHSNEGRHYTNPVTSSLSVVPNTTPFGEGVGQTILGLGPGGYSRQERRWYGPARPT